MGQSKSFHQGMNLACFQVVHSAILPHIVMPTQLIVTKTHTRGLIYDKMILLPIRRNIDHQLHRECIKTGPRGLKSSICCGTVTHVPPKKKVGDGGISPSFSLFQVGGCFFNAPRAVRMLFFMSLLWIQVSSTGRHPLGRHEGGPLPRLSHARWDL